MCNCNSTPCKGTTGCKVKDLSTDCVLYDGEALECLGVAENTPLSEVIKKIDTKICESSGGSSSVLITNVGTGAGAYAGDSMAGQKQFKTFKSSESVDIDSSSTELEFSVNPEWMSQFVFSESDENIVAFSTEDPNSGSPVFNPNLPENDDVIYWSTENNSYWVWDGIEYVTYTPPNTTGFFLSNTAIDAGGNKNAAIVRPGALGIGVEEVDPKAMLHVGGDIKQTVTSSILAATSEGIITEASAGVDYLAPNGSAAALTNFPILNQNTTGNAATVTTIPALGGDVTNTGNNVQLAPTGVTPGSYTNVNVTVDAKGRITAIANGGGARPLADFVNTASNVGTANTQLYLYSIPTGTLANDGDKIEFRFGGTLLNPGVTKSIEITLGNSSQSFGTSINGFFSISGIIIRTSSTSAKFIYDANVGNVGQTRSFVITGLDFSIPVALILSAQGSASGDVNAQMGYIEFKPKV